jgi:hypothetical protein
MEWWNLIGVRLPETRLLQRFFRSKRPTGVGLHLAGKLIEDLSLAFKCSLLEVNTVQLANISNIFKRPKYLPKPPNSEGLGDKVTRIKGTESWPSRQARQLAAGSSPPK